MYRQLNIWWWRYVIRREPRYRIERHKSYFNFGPKVLYFIYDRKTREYIVEGSEIFVEEFLYVHECMNPWLFREEDEFYKIFKG